MWKLCLQRAQGFRAFRVQGFNMHGDLLKGRILVLACRIAALRACGCSDFAILIASLQMVHYSRPETMALKTLAVRLNSNSELFIV